MNDKKSLLKALAATHFELSELVLSLTNQQRSPPYHPGINPPIWEWGHTAFFHEQFMLRPIDKIAPIMPEMDFIWDSFDIDHKDRWTKGVIPSIEATQAYVEEVYQRIKQRIEDKPLTPEDHYLYKYVIFHQHMHIESLIWCRQTLGYPAPATLVKTPSTKEAKITQDDASIPSGNYQFGQVSDSPNYATTYATTDFSFDAERPTFNKHIKAFCISKTLVTRAEFLRFVQDGGYQRPEFWSFGGQKWLSQLRDNDTDISQSDAHQKQPQTGPIYWREQEGVWQERLFDQWQALNLQAPVVHVCYWEAEAWCNWADRRLPTEYEWEAAALGNLHGATHHSFPWGHTMDQNQLGESQADMNRHAFAQAPVTALPESDGPFGLRQTIGTVWEWTSSQFLPYDGFKVDMYPYMSTLQFGYHKVARGGSCATSSDLIRGTYRQAYLPFRRDVYVGFRSCQK